MSGTDTNLVPLMVSPGQPMIVLIHAASGSVLPFFEIARRPQRRVRGVRHQAFEDADSRAPDSIENLAAHYVRVVDGIRGASPVILAGWSMGGCVAVEMAREWQRRGVPVAATLMLDTWTPPAVMESTSAAASVRSTILGMNILGLEGFDAENLDEAPAEVARLQRIAERNRNAFLDYAADFYDGQVDLLRASDPSRTRRSAFPRVISRETGAGTGTSKKSRQGISLAITSR